MATIKQAAVQEKPQTKFWPVIGKAWINEKNGKTLISCVVGNSRTNFAELSFKVGDRFVLRPNNKRPGKKDADYQICLPDAQTV